MACNEAYVEASVEQVWSLLADPWAYPRWVVGSKRTVAADPDWPRVGASFRVEVGAGPFTRMARTTCTHVEPGRQIALRARGSKREGADIRITIWPQGSGTRLTLEEEPGALLRPLRRFLPVHWLIRVRNVEALRRLKRLVEGPTPARRSPPADRASAARAH